MKKQTISKIAAVALAAMTVVPMFGITASADIKLVEGSAATTNTPNMQGTAWKVEWNTKVTTNTWVASSYLDSSTGAMLWKLEKQPGSEVIDRYIDTTAYSSAVSIPGAASVKPAGKAYYGFSDTPPADLQELKNKTSATETMTTEQYNNYKTAIDKYNAVAKQRQTAINNANATIGKSNQGTPYTYTNLEGAVVSVFYSGGIQEKTGGVEGTDYTHPETPYYYVGTTKTNVATTPFNVHNYVIDGTPKQISMSTLASELGSSYATVNAKYIISGAAKTDSGAYYIDTTSAFDSISGNGTGSGVTTPNYYGYQTTPDGIYRYYSDTNPGRYYSSAALARSAGGNGAVWDYYGGKVLDAITTTAIDYRSSVSAEYPYVSSVPNRYYKTAADAIQDAKDHGYSNPTAVNYYTSYYNNPYGYLYGYNYGYGTTTATANTGTATIGNYTGWNYVTRTINAARSGASYTVKMNTETEIPAAVLRALYGKNVTINFKFNSGATLSIKGTDMTSTSAVSTNIRYVKNVPTTLVKKAVSSNSGVSSAQFSVSGGSLGANASVTVKFGTNRSGRTATLYRYNASSNSLTKISTSTVRSNGYCTLSNVAQGGDYVIVLS